MEMKVLMCAYVFWAVGLNSHSLTAASNSPELFKKYSAMSVCSFRSDYISAQVSCFIAFSTQLKYNVGTPLASHSWSLSMNSIFGVSKV